jgi:hypothetical protein
VKTVRGWFGKTGPALSDEACERLANLVARLMTPPDLLRPTADYEANTPKKSEPSPDDMLWDELEATTARATLRRRKQSPKSWHGPAVILSGAFGSELRRVGKKAGKGGTTILYSAIMGALGYLGHTVEAKTISQHVTRLWEPTELTKADLADMPPNIATATRCWLSDQGIGESDLRACHLSRYQRKTKLA